MTPTVILLADGLGAGWLPAHLADAHSTLARSFLHDTITMVRSLRNTRLVLRHGPHLPPAALDGLDPGIASVPVGGDSSAHVAAALADALAEGYPAVLIGATTPHLPPWRLRDAFTHLAQGADAVLGPGSARDWYLLGMRRPDRALLQLLPAGGAPPTALLAYTRAQRRRMVTLPAWFAIHSPADLPELGEVLRSMPASWAAQTRSLLESSLGEARAVGG